jgi:divalent metal cation (Fe/Co/Zn/Cd) transporter
VAREQRRRRFGDAAGHEGSTVIVGLNGMRLLSRRAWTRPHLGQPPWPWCFSAGGVALGFPLANPIIGLLITVAILAVLRTAARDVFRRLMDGVDPEIVDAAERSLAARPGVKAVRSVKMRWIGHRLHADAELDVDPTTSLTDAHRIAHDAEHELIHAVPKLSSALIHAYGTDPGVSD